MIVSSPPAVHAGTPNLTVADARGLPVRELQCYREAVADTLELRITRHSHGPRGQMIESLDPRLASTSPNFRWQHDLAGQPLRTESVDAGVTLALADIAGRALLAISATGVRQTSTYEDSTLPGRLQAVLEQAPGEVAAQVTDRFCWAGQSSAEKDLNLSGQCVRHYDTAGLNQLHRGGINGAVLAQSRQLLAGEQTADWAGDSEQGWQAALDAEAFVTQRTVDATGAQLTQTDACGHVQRLAYDLAGQLHGSWLTLQGQAEQVIVASLRYSAMGQKEQEVHGNGVVTDYDYAPRTQQLIGIRVQRQATARVLQDLRYTYDPVGNVLNVRNDAEATRFWRNQKVVPEQAFAYDSLYQLVQASGREMANRGQQGSQLPTALIPLPGNDDAYTPYTRTYRYDRAGNLTHIQHSAPASNNNYTTQLTVSNRSNRAVLAQDGLLPEDVDALFDDGGHQLALLPGQGLHWTPRGELEQVAPILREGQPDDREWYRYGSDAMRVLKVSQQQAAGTSHVQRVLYLEGLEVRCTYVGETQIERLEVMSVAAGGGAAVRVLHWASGAPAELRNDQVRYSYHNVIGSSGLEVDAQGELISLEEYYPYGGTAVWTARSQVEANYKAIRYSGKERDATGLYYYGYRYHQPWTGRWLSADPGGTIDGLNLYRMVRNNPLTLHDPDGMKPEKEGYMYAPFVTGDIVSLVLDDNLIRGELLKPLRSIIVRDDASKELLERQLHEELIRSGDDIGKQEREIESRRLVMGRVMESDEQELQRLRMEHAIVESLDVISNSGGILSRLDSQKNKIYIVGHGYAGSDVIADNDSVEANVMTAEQVAEDLRNGGLRTDFIDVRVDSCGSADSVVPASFEREALINAAKRIPINETGFWGRLLGSVSYKQSFAQSLGQSLYKLGYGRVEVSGYHGDGGMYESAGHAVRTLADGSRIRRSAVRHIYEV